VRQARNLRLWTSRSRLPWLKQEANVELSAILDLSQFCLAQEANVELSAILDLSQFCLAQKRSRVSW
jgi:hypothetical protein